MAQRWQWTHTYGVHLLVFSIVAVVLAGSGLIAVLAFRPDPSDPGQLTLGEACVPGRWQIVEQQDQLSFGIVTLVGDGPVVEYEPDGTATIDYGDAVTYSITDTAFFNLGNVDTQVSGVVNAKYQVQSETMHYYDIQSQATYTTALGTLDWEINNQPFGYECEGDTMAHEIEDRYRSRLQRL